MTPACHFHRDKQAISKGGMICRKIWTDSFAKLVFGHFVFKFNIQFPPFFKMRLFCRELRTKQQCNLMSFISMHFRGRHVFMFWMLQGRVFQDVRMCVQLHVSMCIRDFPCRLSNMCCHWETHWEDLLNLALTPETPTPTVLSPALCRTPLKSRRLNNEILSGLPLHPGRLRCEEKPKKHLGHF